MVGLVWLFFELHPRTCRMHKENKCRMPFPSSGMLWKKDLRVRQEPLCDPAHGRVALHATGKPRRAAPVGVDNRTTFAPSSTGVPAL